MPRLDIHLETAAGSVTYTEEGDLKRPGEAIERAKTRAREDGHEDIALANVKLTEPA